MTINAANIFGSDVTLDVTTPTEPKLIINLANLQDSGNGGDITTGNGLDDVSLITNLTLNSYASRILSGLILLHLQNQPTDNTDDTNGTWVEHNTLGDKNFVVRDNVSQIEYRYTVYMYTADTITTLDPDNIVTT